MAHNAKKGGEFGANGEWYKGGQFVADLEDTVKGAGAARGPRKVCVAPYEWVVADADTYGIWGEIKDNIEVETKWNEETRKSTVVKVVLRTPVECFKIYEALCSKATHGVLKPREGYERERWYRNFIAYYGTLLNKWLNGERLISEADLANLAKTCNTGRLCYGGNKRGIDVCATISAEEAKAAFEGVYEAAKGVRTTMDDYYDSLVAKAGSGHVGTVGEKIEFGATVEGVRSFEGGYGTTFVVRFRDAGGNLIVWFASNPPDCIEEGAKVSVVGTVKAHDTYADEKQTLVTRCKVAVAD